MGQCEQSITCFLAPKTEKKEADFSSKKWLNIPVTIFPSIFYRMEVIEIGLQSLASEKENSFGAEKSSANLQHAGKLPPLRCLKITAKLGASSRATCLYKSGTFHQDHFYNKDPDPEAN